MDTNKKYIPWQFFPEKFIRFANQFENTDDEFERLTGFLLLDIGVEALLKNYLLMPDVVSSSEHRKREESAKGIIGKDAIPDSHIAAANFDKLTFHNLIGKVREVAKSKVTDEELRNAEHYHGIRNIIYHEGKKTIPSKKDFHEYLAIAKSFLHNLLDVEWENQEQEKNEASQKIIFSNSRRRGLLRALRGHIEGPEPYKKDDYKELQHKIEIATAIFRPKYVTETFNTDLVPILLAYENRGISIYEFEEAFNTLTGGEIDEVDTIYNFIDECAWDITFLRLNILRTHLDLEEKDIHTYLEFKKWVLGPMKPIEEFTPEDVQRVENLDMWAYELGEKIDKIIESYVSQE